jgi:hypothetical protein
MHVIIRELFQQKNMSIDGPQGRDNGVEARRKALSLRVITTPGTVAEQVANSAREILAFTRKGPVLVGAIPEEEDVPNEEGVSNDSYTEFADDVFEPLYREALAYATEALEGTDHDPATLLAVILNDLLLHEEPWLTPEEEPELEEDEIEGLSQEVEGSIYHLFDPESDDDGEDIETLGDEDEDEEDQEVVRHTFSLHALDAFPKLCRVIDEYVADLK